MHRLPTLTAIAVASCLPTAGLAQGDVVILPTSRISLEGHSNVNSFRCSSSTFDAVVRWEGDASASGNGPEEYDTPAVQVAVALPVKALDCGNRRMNQDLSRALEADRFPSIHYALVDYRLARDAPPDSVIVHTLGDLSVAGRTRRVAIVLRGTSANGLLNGSGGVDLLMTDFGVNPPTAFLGMIRTRNAIRVNFDVAASTKGVESANGVRRVTGDTNDLHVIVSIAERRLWVLQNRDTLRSASVAVGSQRTLREGNQSWSFVTPRGTATVIRKEVDPVWIPPDWHYVELARQRGLTLGRLEFGRPVALGNGRALGMREGRAGVLGADSLFQPLPVDEEIVVDNTLYIPPLGSLNRQVPGVLGRYRLVLSNGIGLHGTPQKDSIGAAATHGCVRLHDEDIAWLYEHVPIGTTVTIY